MKKSKKLLIALLSATCLTAGAFGLAACGSAQDDALYKIYTEYVANAGDNAKSYEEWLKDTLENVGKPGDKGEQGKPGDPGADGKSAYDLYKESLDPTETPLTQEEWLQSLIGSQGTPGIDGNSITGVSLSTDGKKLVFTFSKGDPVEITLPESVTHVHTYNDDVVVLIDATDSSNGVGYKTCTGTGCDHIELVVIDRFDYKVKVYLPDNKTPAVGAKVTINEKELEVDEEGFANFLDTGKGAFDVTVELDGYVQVGSLKTTATGKSEYTVLLAQPLDSYAMPNLEKVGDKCTYALTVTGEMGMMEYAWHAVNLTFTSEEAAKYKVTVNDENILFDEYASRNVGYQTATTVDNEPARIRLVVDGEEVSSTQSPYQFCITVEKMQTPVVGSIDLPIAFEADEQVTYTATANASVYYKFNGFSGNYNFEIGSGVTLTYIGGNLLDSRNEVINNNEAKYMGGGNTFYVSATSVSGNISFTMKSNFADGAKAKPIELALDTAKNSNGNAMTTEWYKFTVEEAGEYNLVITGIDENIQFSLYDELLFDDFADNALASYTRNLSSMQLTPGTYYLSTKNECSFTISKYNPETDLGLSELHPFEINETKVYSLNGNTTNYFIYTAPADITVWFTSDNANFVVLKNESFSTGSKGSNVNFNQNGRNLAASGFDGRTSLQLSAGDKVYFYANATGTSASVELFAVTDATAEVAYTVVVTDDDGNVVPNAQVALSGTEKSGTTDNEGKVTFNVAPDRYSIVVTDTDNYVQSTSTYTATAYKASSFSVTVNKLYEYKLTFKDESDAPAPDISVRIQGHNVDETLTTNANGEVIFHLPFSTGTYYVTVSSDKYEVVLGVGEQIQMRGTEVNGVKSVEPYNATVKKKLTSQPITLVNDTINFTAVADTQYTFTYDGSKKLVVTVTNGSLLSLTNPNTLVENGALTDNGNIAWLGMSFANGVLTVDPANANSTMAEYAGKNFVFVFSVGANVTFTYEGGGASGSDVDWSTPTAVSGDTDYEFTVPSTLGWDDYFEITVTNGYISKLWSGSSYDVVIDVDDSNDTTNMAIDWDSAVKDNDGNIISVKCYNAGLLTLQFRGTDIKVTATVVRG